MLLQRTLAEKPKQIVESEKILYKDIESHVENFDGNIKTFERKYGTYD